MGRATEQNQGLRAETAKPRRAQKSSRDSASLDALTGLPDRPLLANRFQAAAKRARGGKTRIAVAFLDLDRFKLLNERHGRSTGDELLQKVSQRMIETLRPNDTVARLGGDQFGILLEDLERADSAAAIAEKLHEAVTAPALLHSELRDEMVKVRIGASIGIAPLAEPDTGLPELLDRADKLMAEAKREGGGVRMDSPGRQQRAGETVTPLHERGEAEAAADDEDEDEEEIRHPRMRAR